MIIHSRPSALSSSLLRISPFAYTIHSIPSTMIPMTTLHTFYTYRTHYIRIPTLPICITRSTSHSSTRSQHIITILFAVVRIFSQASYCFCLVKSRLLPTYIRIHSTLGMLPTYASVILRPFMRNMIPLLVRYYQDPESSRHIGHRSC